MTRAWISAKALDLMEREAERAYPAETGGILIGYWSVDGREAVVVDAIGPGQGALEGIDGFVPDHDYHEWAVADRYRKSSGIHTYLGDWHSHPDSDAYLSRTDLKTLRRIGCQAEARAPRPLMAILAEDSPWRLAVWVWLERRGFLFFQRDLVHQVPFQVYP